MLTLYRRGKLEEWNLIEQIKKGPYIDLYAKPGSSVVQVPFMDLTIRKKRFVRFERLQGVDGWVFIDIAD